MARACLNGALTAEAASGCDRPPNGLDLRTGGVGHPRGASDILLTAIDRSQSRLLESVVGDACYMESEWV